MIGAVGRLKAKGPRSTARAGISGALACLVAWPGLLASGGCLYPTGQGAFAHQPTTAPRPPGVGAVASGTYRNLFAELGHTPADIDRRLQSAFAQLFHGNPRTQAVFFAAGANAAGPLGYVMDIGNGDVRSEGMSYGMMVAVQMNQRAEFDALWNWAKTYMDHADPAHPVYGYFAWQMRPDGTVIDHMPAPDGEEYFATALYFAAARWDAGEGIYNYRQQADRLLDLMKNRGTIAGQVARGRTGQVTTLFNTQQHQVRFTPDLGYFPTDGDHTDPSYHVPAFYELWARWGPAADRPFWAAAARTSRDLLERAAHPETGLVPDLAEFGGRPKARSTDPGTARFRFDAWRAAMNWSVDYAWFAADPREIARSDRLQAFFDRQGMQIHGNNFTIDGHPTSHDHSSGLTAMNAVASLAATDARAWRFAEALWRTPIPTGKWRYYDGLLCMMALLHLGGQFRAWAPPG